jgi:uncharacterized protein (TIGR03086 family)
MSQMDIVDLDRRALAASARLIGLVTPDQLDAPTPCSEWVLRDLLAHMVAHNYGFAATASGEHPAESVWEGEPRLTRPAVAFAESADQVSRAFSADGTLGRRFELPGLGTFPATTAIGFHFVDYVIHAWDVARSIGVPAGLDDDLVRSAARVASGWPDNPAVRGPGAPFGHRVHVASDAPLLDRLLGALGRSPSWPAPGAAG